MRVSSPSPIISTPAGTLIASVVAIWARISPRARVFAGYLLPLLVLYRRLLFEGQTWLDFDFLIENRVRFEILQAGLVDNQIPLWTDGYLGGFPIAFSEFGWFYPPSWLFLRVFSMPLAYHAEAALGLLLAALATYLLGRAWGLGRLSAFIGGYLYGFAPFVFATSLFINFADIFWVLPAGILAIERVAQGRLRYLLLLVLAAAAAILAGHPHIAVILAFAAAIYALFRLSWTYRDRGGGAAARLFGLLVFAGVVGLMLGAVRLLPTLALTGVSTRAGGIDPAAAAGGALHPFQLLLGFLYPAFDLPLVAGGILRAEPLAYAGLLALPLAFGAVIWRTRERPVVFLFALLIISWLLAFGELTPVYGLLRGLPVFELFREPGRYLLPGILALSLLAAFGLEALRNPAGRHTAFARRVGISFSVYAVVLLAFLVAGTVLLKSGGAIEEFANRGIDRFLVGGRNAYFNESGWLGAFALARGRVETAFTLANWTPVLSILTAGVGAGLLWRYGDGRVPARTLVAALGALLVFDLTLSIGHGVPTLPPEIAESTPAVAIAIGELNEGRVFSYRSLADKSELGLGSGRDLPPTERRLLEYLFTRELLTPNLPGRYGLRSLDGYENLMSGRQAEVLAYLGSERAVAPGFARDDTLSEEAKADLLRRRLPILGALGVSTIVAGTDLSAALGPAAFSHRVNVPFDWDGPIVWVYELPPGRGDFYLTANLFRDDPTDSTGRALDRIVTDPAATLLDDDPGFASNPDPAATVQLQRQAPGDWSFVVTGDRPAVLVLNQAALPGWRVSLNGESARLLTANRFALAVVVPPGRVAVEFTYEPPRFGAGVAITLGGLAIVLVMGLAALIGPRLRARRLPEYD